jgi:hypothetical protein
MPISDIYKINGTAMSSRVASVRMPISGNYRIKGTALSLRVASKRLASHQRADAHVHLRYLQDQWDGVVLRTPISGIYKNNGTAMPISSMYKINGTAKSLRMRRYQTHLVLRRGKTGPAAPNLRRQPACARPHAVQLQLPAEVQLQLPAEVVAPTGATPGRRQTASNLPGQKPPSSQRKMQTVAWP